jgi:PAS domain-containing protein
VSTNTAVTQPDPAPPARRVGGLTLRSRLVLLVLAAVLPLLIFGLINQYIAYTAYRERTSEQTLALARALASAVEQELQVRIAALQTLALSPTLHTGDLQAFRHRAEDLVAQHLPGSNILLQHENGQQIMNLALPPDTPLPARQHLDTVHKVFATGQPVVSNLFYGVRLNRPLVSIDVPVRHPDGTIVYCLSMNPPSGIFNDLIRRQQPSRTSRIAIFDSSGTTIARNVDPERSIGQKGPPALLERFSAEREGVVQTTARDGVAVMVAFSHGLRSGWTIAIGIPWDELAAPIRRSTERMLAVGAGALVLALAAALILARRIAGPIAILQRLAATIDSDSSPTAARTGLRETDSVARALQSAAAQREAAERTRVESEARFRAIADNIPQLVWMAGQNGRIFWFNQRWYDYTGLSSDKAPGTSWLAHCHPEHAARVIEGM